MRKLINILLQILNKTLNLIILVGVINHRIFCGCRANLQEFLIIIKLINAFLLIIMSKQISIGNIGYRTYQFYCQPNRGI